MQYIGYIYLTTNLVNGKQYVGQHQSKEYDPYYKGSGTALKLAFDKYGLENFKCEILCWCKTQTELNYREQCEIVFHSTFSPNGYNLKQGGVHGKWTKEARKNASISQKRRFSNTEERIKASLSHKGQKAWNKGMVATDDYRKKQQTVQKCKKVYQYTKDGKFVKEWVSINEIRRCLGVQATPISRCCNGKLKTAYGYIWSFAPLVTLP